MEPDLSVEQYEKTEEAELQENTLNMKMKLNNSLEVSLHLIHNSVLAI